MERRNFLKLTFGVMAGVALAASVQAAPLSPQRLVGSGNVPSAGAIAEPAVTTSDEVDRLKPQEVRWGHHWHHHHGHWGWHRRHWGWHHRHWGWRHRHWGWRHHHWHHRHYW